MKRKIFTLMFCALFGFTMVNAQSDRTGVFKKAATAPVIDGVGDDAAWDDANVYSINLPFKTETPTLGADGETNWKGVWNDQGVYVLVTVTDDFWFPKYLATGDDYLKDKLEIYFDCNSDLDDNGGGSGGPANGHHQFAPEINEADINGDPITGTGTQDLGVVHAVMLDGTNYVMEFFIPFSILNDRDGLTVLQNAIMGFDVTVSDNDVAAAVRNRAVWSNDGSGAAANESWNNMNDCGTITLDGATEIVTAQSIAITSPSDAITTESGTLQMSALILPANATIQTAAWIVESVTGKAFINSDGLLTGVLNGIVTVTAKTKDGSALSASKDITISNQVVTLKDINLIKDGGFATDGPIAAPWSFWSGNGGTAEVIDGVLNLMPYDTTGVEQWQLQVNQNGWVAYNDTTYLLTFTAWADADRILPVDFEDPANSYERFGDTDDEDATPQPGKSEWAVAITTEPTEYVRTVTFKRIQDNTNFLFNIMPAADPTPAYMDNISLVSLGAADLLTPPATSITLEIFDLGTETLATSFTAGEQYQVSATVLPATAAQTPVYSIVNGTGSATITADGLLTAVSAGTVTVVGTDWVDPTVKDELAIDILVGVKDDLANQFSIYPNPVTNELNVKMTSVNSKVVIFNSLGSKIHEVMVNGLSTTIDVSNMARGVYYIQVNDSAAQKFVK